VSGPPNPAIFPPPLDSYTGEAGLSTVDVLIRRVAGEPLLAVATGIFLLALVHTFLAARILALARRLEHRLAEECGSEATARKSFRIEMLHLLGEIEAVFLIWGVPLLAVIGLARGFSTAEYFVGHLVEFTEPMFVVVILAIAASRPVLQAAERLIGGVAGLGGRTPLAWWLAILTAGPLLGSLITEPAAMVISALLLSRVFYDLKPGRSLRYATLGLLFVNISVGGTLTHFAAPPVLMVAGKWGWTSAYMLSHFGGRAVAAIVLANLVYAFWFRREFAGMASRTADRPTPPNPSERVPFRIVLVHLALLGWTVFTAHTPALFIGGFLFFLVFREATSPHQAELDLRSPLLVGCFLAGLVLHGSLQAWWVGPLLGSLGSQALLGGAAVLTAVNDNAAITYLASLVPSLPEASRIAVVAGAVAGGGLTIVANAPNPAGQAVLARHFENGISPLGLLAAAALPTLINLALHL
jgi:hypothetical protein